jgi:hypothetical protein
MYFVRFHAVARSSRTRWGVAFFLTVTLAAFAGYQQIFSTLAPYDDEGYVMLSVAAFLDGGALYQDVYTQYGPGLFAIEGGFHRLTGLPLTHDVVRLRTLAVWLATALLAGGAVWRITHNPCAAVAATVMAFLHLDRLCLEPGHPQELCAAAMMAAAVLATYLPSHGSRCWVPFGLGAAIGFIAMTKLNVGLFLLAGVSLALLLTGPRSRPWRLITVAAAALTLALPVAVTREQLGAIAAWRLPIAVMGGLAAMLVAYYFQRSNTHAASSESNRCIPCSPAEKPLANWRRSIVWMLAGFSSMCVLLAWVVFARGGDWHALWYGMAGQHSGFTRPFYHAAPLEDAVFVVALAGVAMAWWAASRGGSVLAGVRGVFALLVMAALLQYVAETNEPLVHGLNDRGGAGLLITFATPFVWIIVLPRGASSLNQFNSVGDLDLGRLALGAVAVLQPLGAFPAPGTQMAVGSLPLLMVCVVALHDAMPIPRLNLSLHAVRRHRGMAAWCMLSLMLIATLAYRDVSLWRYRISLTRLALPGAERLRVPADVAAEQQWLARRLSEQADTFVFGEHARNSFYLWTGLEPPTGFNATVWPYLLRPDQQRRIVTALRNQPRVCLVREEYQGPRPKGETPLADYLAAHFRRHDAFGRYTVWTRAE